MAIRRLDVLERVLSTWTLTRIGPGVWIIPTPGLRARWRIHVWWNVLLSVIKSEKACIVCELGALCLLIVSAVVSLLRRPKSFSPSKAGYEQNWRSFERPLTFQVFNRLQP